MTNKPEFLWTAAQIAQAIGLTTRQAVHLLSRGKIPARKIEHKWCIRHAVLDAWLWPSPETLRPLLERLSDKEREELFREFGR